MKKYLSYLLLIVVLVLAACSKQEQGLQIGDRIHLPNGDLQEVTASVDDLPTFLNDRPENMQLVYKIAGRATEIIEWIPCYCGCGETADHGNNMNCFIDEIRQDGSVVWDDHSTRCQVCLDTAVDAVKMTQEGKSIKEIRDIIDDRYKEGYAAPTNTPMPS